MPKPEYIRTKYAEAKVVHKTVMHDPKLLSTGFFLLEND